MFTCDVCGNTTRPGTKVRRIPEGYREVSYPYRRKAFEAAVRGKKKPVPRDDPGGEGFELRGIQRACPGCYREWVDETAEEEMPAGVHLPDAGSDVVPVPI